MSTDRRSTKDDTFHIRSSRQDKALIERAASRVGLAASSYMLQNALKAARNDLAEVQTLSLSAADAKTFLDALSNPSKPNAALKSAFDTYKKQTKK